MTNNQQSIVNFAVERGLRGTDFASTWYCGLLRFERAYFADVTEFLFMCGMALEIHDAQAARQAEVNRVKSLLEITADHTTKGCLEARIEKLEAGII